MIGVSSATVIRQVDAGKIPGIRLPSGSRRIPVAEALSAIQAAGK